MITTHLVPVVRYIAVSAEKRRLHHAKILTHKTELELRLAIRAQG